METLLSQCLRNQDRLLKSVEEQRVRPYFQNIDRSSRGVILVGPRGTGKSTFLLQMLKEDPKAIYMSLDHIMFQDMSLYEFAEYIYNQGYRSLYLDEVHFKHRWSFEIKSIYDSFPKMKIILSDSSSLVLREGIADLSRRFPKTEMRLLSFREFIYLDTGILLPKFNPLDTSFQSSPFRLPKEVKEFSDKYSVGKLFKNFIEQGQRPIFLEGRYEDRMNNIIEKTIYSDIPYFLPSLQKNHLGALRSIISHLAWASIPTLNIQNLCNQWEIGKDKVYELLKVLEATGMIHIIYSTLTPKGSSKGDKILFADSSMYFALNGQVGNAREAYFASTLKSAGYSVLTSKDEEICDYVVEGLKFEIGGKNKKRKKSDFVIKDPLDDFYSHEWPLWGLGFLW